MNQIRGLLFDLDGTLIDTNPLHVEAWLGAFADVGRPIARESIEGQIGKGGDNLLPALLGPALAEELGERITARRSQRFQELVEARGVAFLRGARSVLSEAKAYKYRTAIVSSASQSDLRLLGKAVGMDLANLVDVVVPGDRAEKTKPAPDLVNLGCHALHLPPSRCVMVGDSVYDGVAAGRAGAMFVGVRTGFASRTDLADAGARVILKNLEVLARSVVAILSSLGEGALTVSERP
ncbi:MAG: HAD family hydrolase [Polyangiaceae bacterium]